jgi:integrase
MLQNNCTLQNPNEVLSYIANKDASNSTKEALCYAYRKYCKHCNIKTKIPYYQPDPKPIKIPTKEKLEMLIANSGWMQSIKLRISMECGLRPIELCRLKVKDIDLDQKLIYPKTAKHGAPRTLKISENLKNTLQKHITKYNLNPNDKLFKGKADYYGKNFRAMRSNLARKLNDPTIKSIRLYDFRHWYATNLYHKTRDILLVKQQMGHKRIETTLIYTQLLNLNEDEWICKGATNKEEAMKLIEVGFEYVTEIDGTKLFRKRK